MLKSAETNGLTNDAGDLILSVESHKSDLKSAADDGDRDSFITAFQQLQKDSINVRLKYAVLKNNVQKGDAGKPIRDKIKNDFDENKAIRNNCINQAAISLANAQIVSIKSWSGWAAETSETLKQKGAGTSKMNLVLSQLYGRLASTNSIIKGGSADDVDSARNEIHDYYSYAWARYNIARTAAILDMLEPKADENGLSDTTEEIRGMLAEADTLVEEGQQYNQDDFDHAHDLLKSAASKLGSLYRNTA